MAITIKHPFVSAKVDSLDTSRVQPSNWNATHTLVMSAASVVGRGAGAGQTAAVEIPMGTTGQAVLATASQAAAQAAIGADGTQATIAGSATKTTAVDADYVALIDSAAAFAIKKLSWSGLKSTLLTYFNTQYQRLGTTFTALQNFVSSTANVVLAPTGVGAVFLRPNGAASTVGQTVIASSGAVDIAGSLAVGGGITSSGDVVVTAANIGTNFAAIGASGVGTTGMFLRIGNTNAYTPGQNVAGANLSWANAAGDSFGAVAGTWKCIGYVKAGATGADAVTTWMRVA